ncbi:hypothetical protein [Natronoglomus mannanivorans]|uniref:Uncharacterized protein n=1 Tax=Natronoglomus mannanivorans TaxID=2979990 RepID=A0AAP2Z3D1_9EURY|nr:hypothetical protein [Halobacteria archaeon AArc-xg1-1]
MATNDSPTADEEEESVEQVLEALQQSIEQQAEQQEDFQTFLRLKSDPNVEQTEQFQERLIQFIKQKMGDEDVGLSEAAVVLWNEVNRLEQQVREAGENAQGNSPTNMPDSGNSSAAEQPERDNESDNPVDPAFQ